MKAFCSYHWVIPLIIVRLAPHLQPLMFTGALDRCLMSQTRDISYYGAGFSSTSVFHLGFAET